MWERKRQMSKLDDAKSILREIGLPAKQQNQVAGLTLLALAGIGRKTPWTDAKRPMLRIHDIMQFCAKAYRKTYAENTREVFRRQVIHQFEHARLTDRNPDDPTRPTNSGKTCYALTKEFHAAVKHFGTAQWPKACKGFQKRVGKLTEVYNKRKRSREVAVKVAPRKAVRLSPGKHNQLQAKVIETFAPTFAGNGEILYLGDTARKLIHIQDKALKKLSVPADQHGKFPDVIIYSRKQKRLFLIEAVTSHGPVSAKRRFELEELLDKCCVERVYVSAFATLPDFHKWSADIAWETEVWVAEHPSHMIHFNGDRFLP
jgi:type II restriction enzyme